MQHAGSARGKAISGVSPAQPLSISTITGPDRLGARLRATTAAGSVVGACNPGVMAAVPKEAAAAVPPPGFVSASASPVLVSCMYLGAMTVLGACYGMQVRATAPLQRDPRAVLKVLLVIAPRLGTCDHLAGGAGGPCQGHQRHARHKRVARGWARQLARRNGARG